MANPPHATKLNLLTNDELEGLPTNNLESERHLAGFGKRAAVAKFRNQRFTAKGIRNDCTLLISDSFQCKAETYQMYCFNYDSLKNYENVDKIV